ncbi:MAG: threonylcarbamoyl-AMP synthase [Actinobacteria bacterium]|uniref:Threonylcarbamoyl-AMP synthase n=1 Tax=freshwater metagenome TaxID=449393 RepID=A0A6J6RJJ9_9ZZZZ|nr:threonylcarbamoyl-AMP synthase [Actinomycetota bacterium]MSX45483.1 threonylcarbamoyl-AMP synthase [Actinomycetota bacterium]MSX71495.1 threonylcarbamoyl-AMP synthase [Actinomycetota bacterium]MSY69249.1 threonylcarbamoyl-AMP synthase [Actinomycetota bacterium]MTA75428.1 threonylcarbamoyl-AMP synthase [Actinomycetota bacterium]
MVAAAAHLIAGDLVAFPTETVYGLGGDACNSAAVARIYEVKGRPADHPLIVHIASMDRMGDWASDVPEYAIKLARDFWPGPMTLVLKRSELAGDFVTGGQDTVGVRVPDHVVALALLEAFEKAGGKGVAAPSANRFGHVSPTTAAAVVEELGEYLSADDLVLDGGECAVGVESTIIDCTSDTPRILRPGAISDDMVSQSTGLDVFRTYRFVTTDSAGFEIVKEANEIRVSGSLENHYAPAAKVFLCETPTPGQGFIAHANIETPPGVIRLASPYDDEEFARILYSALREADAQGLSEVVVMQPIGTGIAVAIRDRLARASNGR